MTRIFSALFIVLFIISCSTTKNIQPTEYIILMGGQSNMVGLGNPSELQTRELPSNVTYHNYGLSMDKMSPITNHFGPEVGLSQVLQEIPNKNFTIIKYAIGGASLLDWAPDYDYEKAKVTGNERFGNMFASFSNAYKSFAHRRPNKVIGFLWMQGERDARIPEAGKDYYQNFEKLIRATRKLTNNPNLPILFGEVNPPSDKYAALDIVRDAQVQISKNINECYLIETDDLSKLKDNLHYDSRGQINLGRRFGEQLIKLLQL